MTTDKEGKKTLRVLAFASFLNDVGAEMVYPIWPFFVTNVLKANMATLGLIDGLGDAAVSLSQAFSGYWSDRLRKRKIFIWLGYLCGSMSRIGYALTVTWSMLIPFRILDRAGKIRAAPRDAMIADLSHRGNRGENFGIVRMADYMGGVCGIIACILFLGILEYQKLFLIAALPSLLGVIIIIAVIRDKPPATVNVYRAVRWHEIGIDLKLFFILSAVFALATFSYSFLLIFANDAGFKLTMIPVLYLGYNVVASLCTVPFGIWSDRYGRKTIMLISFILWGLVCATLLYKVSFFTIVIALGLYGMHKGAFEVVQKAFAAELSPAEFRASCMGYYQMVIGVCALPASFVAGFLWDKMGIRTPLYYSLALTGIAAVLLYFVREPKEHTQIVTRKLPR